MKGHSFRTMRIFLLSLFIFLNFQTSAQVCADSIHTIKYTSNLFIENGQPLSLTKIQNKGRVVTSFGRFSKIVLNIHDDGRIRWAKEIGDRNTYTRNSVIEHENKSIFHVRGLLYRRQISHQVLPFCRKIQWVLICLEESTLWECTAARSMPLQKGLTTTLFWLADLLAEL